jgi:DNA polymerase I-like protein with 3'-5' exonuclease and polymerase domains/5'-3' exonuclease
MAGDQQGACVKRLLIDISSVLRAAHFAGTDSEAYRVEFEGKTHNVNSAEYAYDGFMGSLKTVLNQFKIPPRNIVVCKDGFNSRVLRQGIFAGYKGKRPKSPDEVNREYFAALDGVCDEIMCLGGTVLTQDNMEADDLIAYLAKHLLGRKVIWSRDGDMLALIDQQTDVYLKDQLNPWISPACPPEYTQVYKALCGDSSDCFPGAKGFGPDKFEKLVLTFGYEGLDMMKELIEQRRLPELAEDAEEFKPLKKVIEHQRDVYIGYALARFYPDRINSPDNPLTIEMKVEEVSHFLFEEFKQQQVLVTADNFPQLRDTISRDIAAADWVALDVETDVYEESLEWIRAIQENVRKDAIKLDMIGSQLTGLSICCGINHHKTYYFSIEHADTANLPTLEVKQFLLAELQAKRVVCHRAAGFELPVIWLNWQEWLPNVHCSKILSSYVDENQPTDLKGLSSRFLQYEQITYEEVTQGRGMSELTGKEVLNYGCDDSVTTSLLYSRGKLVTEMEGTWDVYDVVETDSQYLTAMAQADGFTPDLQVLEELRAADQQKYEENLRKIKGHLVRLNWPGTDFEPLQDLSAAEIKRGYLLLHGQPLVTQVRKLDKLAAAAGGEYGQLILEQQLEDVNEYLEQRFTPDPKFNPKSPVDNARLVYEVFQCPVRFRNQPTEIMRANGQKQGNPSTDNDVLKWAAQVDLERPDAELIELIIDCRAILTRDSLYFSKYPWFKHWQTGKIHPNLNQSSTTSRRFAPSAPNINQLPKRSEEGKKVRRVVAPHKPEALIVAPDFKSQELRTAAAASLDQNFIDCYVEGSVKDLHALTGHKIYCKRTGKQISYEEFETLRAQKDEEARKSRVDGKTTNFLAQFGGQAFTLSKQLVVPEETTQMFLDARAEAFPGYIEWAAGFEKEVEQLGYSYTMLGARKHIRYLLDNTWDRGHILRSAVNFHIQSSAAEQTKLAMARVWRSGILNRYDCRFYFPVHDELVFSVAKHDLVAFCYELGPLMKAPYADMVVAMDSQLSVGPNFCDLINYEWPVSPDSTELTLTQEG